MRADLASLKCVCDKIARAIKSAESSKIAESSAIFLLQGDIGAGKTTLVREFAKYIGISDSVTSPTFSLLHIYSSLNSSLGASCGDFGNLGRFADSSPVSHPKFPKNSTTSTANTRIFNLDSANQAQIAESMLKIYHYDLYQKGVDSALDLGLLDLLSENGIHFVEWGDRRLFNIIKDAFENIFIIQITKAKNDRIYEFKSEF